MSRRMVAVGAAVLLVGALPLTGWAATRSGADASTPTLALRPVRAPVEAPGAATTSAVGSAAGSVLRADPAWVDRVASATGIPAPAAAAYGGAVLTSQREDPGCAVGWTTLAGIGWVESHHGTLDGRTLGADGRSDRPVIGPTLDGAGPVAAVTAHPRWTRWHGDTRWEHAVGPMQFLGSSWDRSGADGDGDGTTDPTDLDDAALAAAHLLCAASDLDGAQAWTDAVLAYNPDLDYVHDVHAAAQAYADRTAS